MIRSWAIRVLVGVVAIVLAAAAALVGPWLWLDMRMDNIARVVSLDWRDFGRDRALQRLEYELDAQGVPEWLPADACKLDPSGALTHTVACEWSVPLRIPGRAEPWPLSFASNASASGAP